jgi:hypothetical protein
MRAYTIQVKNTIYPKRQIMRYVYGMFYLADTRVAQKDEIVAQIFSWPCVMLVQEFILQLVHRPTRLTHVIYGMHSV